LGETLEQAQQATHGQVVEGVKSCSSIQGLAARVGVEVPIANAVRRVCNGGQSPRELARDLLGRTPKPE
jgi:glycerol-3-phosphate dehydrogenase (NAD(P)+)